MKPQNFEKVRGFSLIELLIAMALGLILLASATQLFKNGMDSSRLVSQRAEMQDNVRAATNMIIRDVGLAGSGLPPGGLNLPQGAGSTGLSLYGRDPVKTWVTPNTYPTGCFGPPTCSVVTNFMYGIVPGPLKGMENGSGFGAIPATGQVPDAITSIYADYTFRLHQYLGTFADDTGTKVNFALPAIPPVPPLSPTINGPGGIQAGDLVLLQNGFGAAIGEVTNVGPTSITFAAGDTLKMNQTGAATGSILNLCQGNVVSPCTTSGTLTARRIYAVTYFIQVPAVAGQLPKLMRQVDAQPAQPVADNITGLKFSYDVCDGSITPGVSPNCAGVSDLFAGGFTPNNIHKVNVTLMGQSILSYGNHAQNMQMTASVSTRDLTFKDHYK